MIDNSLRYSESSYFSDASNSDYDEHLIIPDASCSDDSDVDDITIKPSQPPIAKAKQEEPIVEQINEPEPIEIEDIESVDDRTDDCDYSVNSSKDDSLTTQSRLEQWETKLKEEKSNSLQRRLERKSLDLLGSLDDKKKNLFETFDDKIHQAPERPATVAVSSLGKLGVLLGNGQLSVYLSGASKNTRVTGTATSRRSQNITVQRGSAAEHVNAT